MLPEPNYTMRCIIHEKGSISSMSGPSPIHSAACRETRIEASPHLSAQGFFLHLVWQYRGNGTTAKEYEARQLPTIYCVQMWFNLVKIIFLFPCNFETGSHAFCNVKIVFIYMRFEILTCCFNGPQILALSHLCVMDRLKHRFDTLILKIIF
jgi:hypothetical protein